MSQFNLSDLMYNANPSDCCDKNSPFFGCTGQEILQARYAAEYVQLGPHVACEFWILADQVERRPEGPDPTDSVGEEWDPVYGEPTLNVRPRSDEEVAEGWDFRGPYSFLALISETNSDYLEDEKGSARQRNMTIQVAKFAICKSVSAGVGGGAEAGDGLGCPSAFVFDATISPSLPMDAPPETAEVFNGDRLRPGDVVYIGDGWNEFFDVDTVGRRGYTEGKKVHTFFEIELVRRSKYLPRRKDILPNSENRALGNKLGTEFLRDDQRPIP